MAEHFGFVPVFRKSILGPRLRALVGDRDGYLVAIGSTWTLNRSSVDLLVRFPQRPRELWATCAFAQQVDSNGQKICSVTDNMPAGEREQKNALSIALYQSLIHFARVHHDCVAQAGAVDARLGRNPDTIYGPGWQSKTSCTLIQARDQCSAAMGLE